MKITKRIISLIAAVAVLATMFVAVPVSAATEEVELFKIDFNNDAGKNWTTLGVWSNTTDGFYNPTARHDTHVVENNALTMNNALQSWLIFNNVGANQAEGSVVDDAQYFGADSIFGTPYYVEFDVMLPATNTQVMQLFGQTFEGTLDGQTVISSGPHIYTLTDGRIGVANGFASDSVNTLAKVNSSVKFTANTWNKLRVYVDPAARTYKVWINPGTTSEVALHDASNNGAAFKFGPAFADDGSGAGTQASCIVKKSSVQAEREYNLFTDADGNSCNINAYLASKGNPVLAPNRTRIQTAANKTHYMDNFRIYRVVTDEVEEVANEMIEEFYAANNDGVIAERIRNITLPRIPEGYDSSLYTYSWSSDNTAINTSTGKVTAGTVSDAVLTLTVSASGSTVTKTAKVSLPVSYLDWVGDDYVDFEIGGVRFQSASDGATDAEKGLRSPVPGGKLLSVYFTNVMSYDVNLIAAIYDGDGRLVACKIVENPDDGRVEIDLDIPATATNPEVKFFAWSTEDGITPLTTDAQLYEEAGRTLFILSAGRVDGTTLGAALESKFDTTKLPIVDLSASGVTLKRYATEDVSGQTRLQSALGQIDPGDYVVLTFGYYDYTAATTPAVYDNNDPDVLYTVGTFGYYYQKYIEAIRSAGGVPIILAPIPRTKSGGYSNYISCPYLVANDNDIPFLNINTEAQNDFDTKYYTDAATCEKLNAEGVAWIAQVFVNMTTDVKLPFAKYVKN